MKTAQIQIRVSEADKARLKAAARREGVDLSTYVLSRSLPSGALLPLFEQLAVRPMDSFHLAELNDVLSSQSAATFRADSQDEPPGLDLLTMNYVAAMIEMAAYNKKVAPPAWVDNVRPLSEPWFATQMPSLRLHLLANSPAAFRRRNLFVDTSIGGRV